MSEERTFPVLDRRPAREQKRSPYPITSVPWSLLAPHALRAQKTLGRTLDELAAEGGLDVSHIMALLNERRWRPMHPGVAFEELGRHLFAHATVRCGCDDDREGAYVEFFCGAQWNRVYQYDEPSAEALRRAIVRFKLNRIRL